MKKNDPWIIKAFLFTFFITLIVSGISNFISNNCHIILLVFITILIIAVGIIFDIIGTSVLTAKEASFHAMASSKVKGSKESIKLIKNSSNIANFCNDIIGDICGIVSGSMGAIIAIYLADFFKANITIVAVIISATISSLTVGGKAIGKKYAVKNSASIVALVGKLLSSFKRKKHRKN